MSRKEVEINQTFSAFDPSGEEVEIVELQHYAVGNTSSGPYKTATLKEFQTQDGRHVNRIEKGKYQIVEDDIEVTSDDPGTLEKE